VHETPETWHHGLIAEWWAEFNDDFRPHELDYYRRFTEAGQPVLEAGCGSGRILVPLLASGIDIDGCDVSGDMIEVCRRKAEARGVSTRLAVQAMHRIDMPRSYRTIIVVGAFGLGSSRERDEAALDRFYEHLEPGGRLILDSEVPYADEGHWRYWVQRRRRGLPEEIDEAESRREASDGSEYALRSRIIDVNPLQQRVSMEIRARRWVDSQPAGEETHRLDITYYFPAELRMMIERAGFEIEAIHGEHQQRDPQPDDEFVVFVARRP
jgi:SAM-dependent methyltransferase